MSSNTLTWDPPQEVKLKEIPKPRADRDHQKYDDLIRDIGLRLECTPRNRALCYTFADKSTATRIASALRYRVQQTFGPRAVRIIQRDQRLYISRDQQWTRYTKEK